MRLIFKLRNGMELTDIDIVKLEGYIHVKKRKINFEIDLRDLKVWREFAKISKKQREEFFRKLYGKEK